MRTGLLIALGIIIGSTLSTIIASAWTAPTASPPGNNVASPINVGATSQLKNGTLGVNGLGVFGNTILNGTNGDGNGNGVNSYLNFGATAGTERLRHPRQQRHAGIQEQQRLVGIAQRDAHQPHAGQRHHRQRLGADHLHQVRRRHDADDRRKHNPWSTNGTSIYYNGGNVGIGTASPYAGLTVEKTTVTGGGEVVCIFPRTRRTGRIDRFARQLHRYCDRLNNGSYGRPLVLCILVFKSLRRKRRYRDAESDFSAHSQRHHTDHIRRCRVSKQYHSKDGWSAERVPYRHQYRFGFEFLFGCPLREQRIRINGRRRSRDARLLPMFGHE